MDEIDSQENLLTLLGRATGIWMSEIIPLAIRWASTKTKLICDINLLEVASIVDGICTLSATLALNPGTLSA